MEGSRYVRKEKHFYNLKSLQERLLFWESQNFQQLILLMLWLKLDFSVSIRKIIGKRYLIKYEMRIILEERLTER